MKLIVGDFESFFGKGYSLRDKGMTHQKYIMDERFKAHGCGLKIDGGPARWIPGKHLEAVFAKIDWSDACLIGHNLGFDATILAWRYGIYPARYIDTLALARAQIGANAIKHGLDALGELLLGSGKPEGLSATYGLRELTPEIEANLAYYCVAPEVGDCDKTWALFKLLMRGMTKTELLAADWCTRVYLNPKFMLDQEVLAEYLDELAVKKAKALDSVGMTDRSMLNSAEMFAGALRSFGVDPPTKMGKPSKKTEESKIGYAFAKTDQALKDLLDHPRPEVQALVAARLEIKSTNEENKAGAYYESALLGGAWPVSIKYAGAMNTQRFSGDKHGGGNPQNLGRGSRVRDAICAPQGYKIMAADLSQIEVRVTLQMAAYYYLLNRTVNDPTTCREMEALDTLRAGEDLYCWFGSMIYGRQITKADKTERQVSKAACIAEGSLVLTQQGLVPIENITLDHRVWDGVEWVAHQGLVYKGEQEIMTYDGLTATPDHRVCIQGGAWVSFAAAASRGDRIVATGHGGQAVRIMGSDEPENYPRREADQTTMPLHGMWAAERSQQRQPQTGDKHGVSGLWKPHYFPRIRSAGKTIGKAVRRYCRSLHEAAQQGVCPLWRSGHPEPFRFSSGVHFVGAGEFTPQGLHRSGDRSQGQRRPLRAGQLALGDSTRAMQQQSEYSVLHLPAEDSHTRKRCVPRHSDDRPEGSVFGPDHVEPAQSGASDHRSHHQTILSAVRQTQRTYDLTNAGPRHRFTVSGKLVHNCLGLGFGMGAKRFNEHCREQGVPMTMEMAETLKNLYRKTFPNVVKSWTASLRQLSMLVQGLHIPAFQRIRDPSKAKSGANLEPILVPELDPLFGQPALRMPNGQYLKYPMLTCETKGTKTEWHYWNKGNKTYVFGGKVWENCIQALAGQLCREMLVELQAIFHAEDPGMGIELQVHDELVALIIDDPDWLAWARDQFNRVMQTAPSWMPELPVACETKEGYRYGECH